MSDLGYFHNNNNNGNNITNNNVVSSSSSTAIPLKEWTKLALQQSSINNASSSASSSSNNTYLSSALTIAKSLVDQICSTYYEQQQGTTTNIFGGWDDQLQFQQQQKQQPSLPTPGSNWSDHIIVHLNNNNTYNNEGYNSSLQQPLSSLPTSDSQQQEQEERQDRKQEMQNQELSDMLLNSLINDNQSVSQSQQVVSYLNVIQAEILPSPQDNSNRDNSNNISNSSKLDEMKHIYSLGIVFYQLFTGGQDPTPELLMSCCQQQLAPPPPPPPTNNNSLLDNDDDENDVRQFQAGFFLDLENELNVFENDIIGSDELDREIDGLFSNDELQQQQPSLENNNNNAISVPRAQVDVDVQVELEQQEQQPSRKKKSSFNLMNNNSSSSTISSTLEQLKLKGLPTSITNLIINMINSINGTISSSNETYTSIHDIQTDLQLMLYKPNKYLYELDVDKLAITGLLPMNEYELEIRSDEFGLLLQSYKRCISSSSSSDVVGGGNTKKKKECGIIVGPSGIGKSVLANRLGNYVKSSSTAGGGGGGLFISGKFDQMQQPTPFSALSKAFNDYCTIIMTSSSYNIVKNKLHEVLGDDARYLIKVIPNLTTLLGYTNDSSELTISMKEGQDCVDAQKRLQYLLCQFVNVISTFSGVPIVLFLDDVQWADPASISAIEQLLLLSASSSSSSSNDVTQLQQQQERQFYFLASSRDEGMLNDHPFKKMLSNIQPFGIHATVVTLTCMSKEMTNTMISELLCLSPRLTCTLSEIIHHKSKGNPLFFSQLMLSLSRDGLIRLSLSKRRWVWDEEKIQSTKLPDDVASFLSSTINRLPREVQESLFTLACFGNRSEISLMKALEKKVGTLKQLKLIESLDLAVEAGLLDKIDDSYVFGHDWLQEAAYNTVRSADRCLFHFKYGVALVPRALELQDDSMLFTAASQINMGGPASVEDAEQSLLVANLNLTAGLKAMEMSDFVSAYNFCDHGISFLRKKHWKEHYTLSLNLFEAASKCALVTGDVTSLKLLSEQIQVYATSFRDKLNSMYYNVIAMAYSAQLPESVDRSISILSQLGEELPDSYTEMEMNYHIEQTKMLLKGFTEQELIEYKRMDDPLKLIAMKFLARLEISFLMIKPDSQPITTLKMVQLSIAHGMSPVSPVGFVFFGQLLARLGYIQDGCHYVTIARKMLDRFGTKEIAGEVIAVATQITCFVQPVQATLESHVQGHTIAMAAGDTHGACLNSALLPSTSFWAGTKLHVCKERLEHACRLMEERGNLTFLAHIIQMKKWFNRLMGLDGESAQAVAENATSNFDQAAQDLQTTNPHASYTFYLQNMYITFILRDYDQMKAFAEKYFAFNLRSWSLLFIHTAHTFYGGLVSFWVYRQTKDLIWAERGRQNKATMKKWCETASQHNFQHKLHLLEAEEAFCNGDFINAKTFYEHAVTAARKHRFVNEEALACELAGYFFLEIDDKDLAIQYFLQAHEKYHEWGAVAKSNMLFEFVQRSLLLSTLSSTASPDLRLSISSTDNGQSISSDDDTNQRKRGVNS